ncbi:hypothetical protein PHIM7_212 [Sinorhizobium phage phiM7]|uniref:Uncharacterized protein n=3 Tax=Emdodecavirus TaxID=1980937 RepID=S5MQ04_9CAUD|nr:hypothetical protein AB690_gp294 [Sinorhizobium phage phiM12]YP_009212464.1 hypothetical protein AVT40_gp309 [Sinorhizobium phage phiN3]YP_009601337.1 hypothetical protein FDH46_gp266 [Sinorhizobium phage phiM7]AKF13117.1 hypothetical protein PHIM19_212 [Sinorhizobium phage phiM19]AGR47915.1 hypothetical protein SmphiM12_283 [Sinorhizobium phage phiM12]AKF12757.1 hypothetical protein PHIM7_212 [Sinorhizobium phage phiM7]AKF13487.1 hypothetical protein PHIN3_224 [Sinorhizobium phage phiN3]
MGYGTSYKLKVINEGDDYNRDYDMVVGCTHDGKDETFVENFLDQRYLFGNSEQRWYEHEHDMRVISKKFPGVLFILEGEGEEAGDIWRKYFKSGKCQDAHAKITFDEFDESKLK